LFLLATPAGDCKIRVFAQNRRFGAIHRRHRHDGGALFSTLGRAAARETPGNNITPSAAEDLQ